MNTKLDLFVSPAYDMSNKITAIRYIKKISIPDFNNPVCSDITQPKNPFLMMYNLDIRKV